MSRIHKAMPFIRQRYGFNLFTGSMQRIYQTYGMLRRHQSILLSIVYKQRLRKRSDVIHRRNIIQTLPVADILPIPHDQLILSRVR